MYTNRNVIRRPRPRIQPPRTSIESVLELITILAILASWGVAIWGWMSLPGTIPTHFGFSGRPDSYGGKGFLFLLPSLSIGLYILLTLLNRYPHIYNYPVPITEENASGQYFLARLLIEIIKCEICVLFLLMTWGIVQSAQQAATSPIIYWSVGLSLIAIITALVWYIRAARAAS